MSIVPATRYEQRQNFNRVTSWLHGFRYAHITGVFDELAFKLNRPIKVVEIGCAHGKLFGLLTETHQIDYVGIEPDTERADAAESRYSGHANFRLVRGNAEDELARLGGADVIVCLETLEHIPERAVVRIIEAVAAAKPGLFVCSVPVEVGPAVWAKNVGSWLAGYSRHNEYTWEETWWAGLGQLDKLPPHGTGHKGFDWRWLAQTIRGSMRIRETRKFPFASLPAATSSSVFMIAESR